MRNIWLGFSVYGCLRFAEKWTGVELQDIPHHVFDIDILYKQGYNEKCRRASL